MEILVFIALFGLIALFCIVVKLAVYIKEDAIKLNKLSSLINDLSLNDRNIGIQIRKVGDVLTNHKSCIDMLTDRDPGLIRLEPEDEILH